MLINEARRQEILRKLEQERNTRKILIEEGNPQPYMDPTIIGQKLFVNSKAQSQIENTGTISLDYSEYSEQKNQTFSITNNDNAKQSSISNELGVNTIQTSQFDERILQQRVRLNKMKSDLFKAKENRKPLNPNSLARLATSKEEMINQRLQMKQQEEDQQVPTVFHYQFNRDCTFKPELNPTSELLANIKYSKFENSTVFDRLNILEHERQQHIENLKQAQCQQEEQEQQSSALQVGNDSVTHIPVYMRIASIAKEKQCLIQNLQDQREQQEKEEHTFHPLINPQSHVIAMIKSDGEDVLTRLTRHGIQRQQRLFSADQPEYLASSFQPQLNTSKNEESIQRLGLSTNFLERQSQHQKNLALKQNELYALHSEENGYTFKPQIDKNSELMQVDQKLGLVERLYVKEMERKARVEQENQQMLSRQFTFTPQINSNSKLMAKDRQLSDLFDLNNTSRQDLCKQQAEDQINSECSFYPSTSKNPRYSKIESPYTFDNCSEVIREHQKQKNEIRAQLIRERESHELDSCTFKPSLTKKKTRDVGCVEVRGMQQYLEQKDHLHRKRQEDHQRNEKLFEKHKFYDTQKHSKETKPNPFKLTEAVGRDNYSKGRSNIRNY